MHALDGASSRSFALPAVCIRFYTMRCLVDITPALYHSIDDIRCLFFLYLRVTRDFEERADTRVSQHDGRVQMRIQPRILCGLFGAVVDR